MMLLDEDAHPLDLYHEVRTWFDDVDATEPETIAVVAKLRGIDIPRVNLDKLQAVINLRTMALAATDAEVFENTVTAFNGVAPIFGITQDCSPHQLMWGVTVINEVLSELDTPVQWHELVDREPAVYTAAMCFEAGLLRLPPLLAYAQEALLAVVPSTSRELARSWGDHQNDPEVIAHEALVRELDDYVKARAALRSPSG